MQCVERVAINKIKFLSTLTLDEYVALASDEKFKNKEERLANFNYFKDFCKYFLLAKGTQTRQYYQKGGIGRFICAGSIQGILKAIRGFLLCETTTDVDMVNCHPVLLKYVCKQEGIICPNLEYYIAHRNDLIQDNPTIDVKDIVRELIYASNRQCGIDFLKKIKKEFIQITSALLKTDKYKHFLELVAPDEKNRNAKALSLILQDFEKDLLLICCNEATKLNIEIAVLMHDGLMVYGNYYEDKDLLKTIEYAIQEKYPGLNAKFAYKQHITILNEKYASYKPTEEKIRSFEIVKKEFEITHCKIIGRGEYIAEKYHNGKLKSFEIVTPQKLKNMYCHLAYEAPPNQLKNYIHKREFISEWISFDNEAIRQRQSMKCLPYTDKDTCPPDIYNTWTMFEMEYIDDYVHNQEGLDFMLHHIMVMCDNDEDVYDYLILWIAHMIRKPAQKTGTVPVLISDGGSGKGSLLKLLEKMLGKSKVFDTTKPDLNVWGSFNPRMLDCYLVNINELHKSQIQKFMGVLKGLATDSSLTINIKGVSQFEVESFHRFIIMSNNHEPLTVADKDRRFFVIRSSDEYKDDKKYWTRFNEYLGDNDVLKTCYEYFKNLKEADDLISKQKPETEHHKNLVELSKSKELEWLEYFVLAKNPKSVAPKSVAPKSVAPKSVAPKSVAPGAKPLPKCNNVIEYTIKELHEDFKEFIKKTNGERYNYETSINRFGVRLSCMKLKGLTKGQKKEFGNSRSFDFKILMSELKLDHQPIDSFFAVIEPVEEPIALQIEEDTE